MWWHIAISLPLLAFFVMGAWFNIESWYRRGRGERFPSIVPLFPGIAGTIGILLLPVRHTIWFAWIALVLDVGCLPYFVGCSAYLTHEAYVHSQRFLVMHLQGRSIEGTKSEINLYRNGDCILKQTEFQPSADNPSAKTVSLSMLGKWQQDTNGLLLQLGSRQIRFDAVDTPPQYQWSASSDAGLLDGLRLHIIPRIATRP